ncbi:MAG: flagellin [Candidatus Brocadiia bacterium]
MGLRINTNMAALIGQRNVERTDRALSTALERLSSGLRINAAADDPAGLAIAERQGAQIAGLNQAVENTERALSMAQTAEGALEEVNSILVHIRELVIDSANEGANDANSLAANQAEIDNALDTLDRIARDTAFGTKKLLDGSAANLVSLADGTNDSIYASFGNSTLATGTYSLQLDSVTDASWDSEDATTLESLGFVDGGLTDAEQDVEGLEAGAHVVKVTQASTVSSITGDVDTSDTDYSAAPEEFKLTVYDGSAQVTSADLTIDVDLSGGFDLDALVADIQAAIDADGNVGGKVEAYAVDSDTVGFRTTSEGSDAYVAIAAPDDDTDALSGVLTGFTDGDNSDADGTQGTDAVVELDGSANTVSYVEGDSAATNTTVTLSDGDDGQLKVQADNTGLDVGSAIVNVTAASGLARIYDAAGGSSGSGVAGTAVTWTADSQFSINDYSGNSLRVTIGNEIRLNGSDAYEDVQVVDNSLVFQVGGDRNQTVSLSLLDVGADTLAENVSTDSGFSNLSEISVLTSDGAQDGLLLVDQAIDEVTDVRSDIGSFQANTLESQLNNLRVASENLTSARSTIVDADFAVEVSEFTKQQILLQAGMTVLGSAGQVPQLVLGLLG